MSDSASASALDSVPAAVAGAPAAAAPAPAPASASAEVVHISPFLNPGMKFEIPMAAARLCPFVNDVVIGDTTITDHATSGAAEVVLVPCATVESLAIVMEYVLLAHANAALPMLTIHRPMETWDMTDALIPQWAADFAERLPLEQVRDVAATATCLRMSMLHQLMAARVASDVKLVPKEIFESFGTDTPAFANYIEEREYYLVLEKANPWGKELESTPFEDPDASAAEIAAAKALMPPVPVADNETRQFTPRRPVPSLTPEEHKTLTKRLIAVNRSGEPLRDNALVDPFCLAVAMMLG
jgi:hypothetical protein